MKIFFKGQKKFLQIILLIIWSYSISVGTYIISQGKSFKTRYPFNKQLDNYSLRLHSAYVQARKKKDLGEFFNTDRFNFDMFIKSAWHNVNKKVIDISPFTYDYYKEKNLPASYIDLVSKDLIIGTNGKGEIFKFSLKNNTLKKVKSNLNDIYLAQNFKGIKIKNLKGAFGTRDIFYDGNTSSLFVSLLVDITGEGCYGMAIYKASLKESIQYKYLNELKFNEFYKMRECNKLFGGHAAGGRIKKLKDNLIFTVGSLDVLYGNSWPSLKKAQSTNNDIGKVISLNKKGESKVISSGHRNQQGLLILDEKIIITEHGPQGGDEINMIKEGKHYGWPYYSYGYGYDNTEKFRSPHEGIYEKPLYYFTPSIATSEIIFYEGSEFPKWKNKFILSSLKEKSLYLMDYDKDKERILSSEKINIGHRIRDLLVLDDGKLLLATDDQKILILSRARTKRIINKKKISL